MSFTADNSMESISSASSSEGSPRAVSAQKSKYEGRRVSIGDPDPNPIKMQPRSSTPTEAAPAALQNRASSADKRQGFLRRISNSAASVFSRRDSSSGSTSSTTSVTLPHSTFANLSLKDKFRLNTNPKLLLVPEGHDSRDSKAARQLIHAKSENIRSFSEGSTGQKALHGLRGIEQQANFEIAPILRQFMTEKEYPPNQLPPTAINTEEKVYEALKDFGVSKDQIKQVKSQFFGAKTPAEQEQAITYFQNHFRDEELAKAIRQECKALKKDPDANVGVGFFGATHLVAGHDEDAARSTDKRIPDLLLEAGKQGDECIRIHGVDVYIYPKVLAGEGELDDFRSYFE